LKLRVEGGREEPIQEAIAAAKTRRNPQNEEFSTVHPKLTT